MFFCLNSESSCMQKELLKTCLPILVRRFPVFPGTWAMERISNAEELVLLHSHYYKNRAEETTGHHNPYPSDDQNDHHHHHHHHQPSISSHSNHFIVYAPHRSFPHKQHGSVPRLLCDWPGEDTGTLVKILKIDWYPAQRYVVVAPFNPDFNSPNLI